MAGSHRVWDLVTPGMLRAVGEGHPRVWFSFMAELLELQEAAELW